MSYMEAINMNYNESLYPGYPQIKDDYFESLYYEEVIQKEEACRESVPTDITRKVS